MKFHAVALLAATTFNRDVLPILQDHCQECHRAYQIAPMPFVTFQQTRPWAKAMLEAVMTRTMPPWFADPAHGDFANNPSLAKSEIETIANWVRGGAPEGNPADKPLARSWASDWNIGKPDRVIEMPTPVAIPAAGTIEYQYVILPGGFARDTWVQKVEVRPGNPAVVHHAVVYTRERGSKWLAGYPAGVPFSLPADLNERPNPALFTTNDILFVYTPGNNRGEWLEGMAKRIRAGSDIVIQFHYTANGKEQQDRTRVGLVFAAEAPKLVVLTLQMGNDRFVIPPGDPNYRVQVTGSLPNEALLISLFPHMHLRGKAFEYSLPAGHGRLQILLKIEHYDFRWQLSYKLRKPRLLPAGTQLLFIANFDNSPNNPFNPNPAAEVRYGEQSWQEMMIGFFDVAVDARFDKESFFASRPSK